MLPMIRHSFAHGHLPSSSSSSILRRTLMTSAPRPNTFSRPSPPPLSRSEQKEFEDLQRRVNAPASAQALAHAAKDEPTGAEEDLTMHPDYRRTPEPTFEGDTNPETGEIGGPKREPLVHGDWSYGGRATDF